MSFYLCVYIFNKNFKNNKNNLGIFISKISTRIQFLDKDLLKRKF